MNDAKRQNEELAEVVRAVDRRQARRRVVIGGATLLVVAAAWSGAGRGWPGSTRWPGLYNREVSGTERATEPEAGRVPQEWSRPVGIGDATERDESWRVAEETTGTTPGGLMPIRMRVDLNSASVEEIALLPGIGPKLADRIVTYREAHGPFTELEGVSEVSGIGPLRLEQLRPYLLDVPASRVSLRTPVTNP